MLLVIAIGVQFTLWVKAHLAGAPPPVPRPAGVEGFLPINAMLTLKHLLLTGVVDAVHPAGLAIFIAICLMSFALARSFCSHICPVGLASELLGRGGAHALGRNLKVPRWLDLPLRGLKLFLLGFFAWVIWVKMDASSIAAFISSPYAKVADAKMWLYFAHPTRLTVAVIGLLVVGSFFIRDLWCRYLCPCGALLGLLGRLAPLKVARDESLCGCRKCTAPARTPRCTACSGDLDRVHRLRDCVMACPVKDCLAVRAADPHRLLRPATAAAVAVGIWLAVVAGFRLAGHWQTEVSEAEYRRRLVEIDSPVYTHVGGMAAAEDPVSSRMVSSHGASPQLQ
jgi:polyferredoxin